MCLQCMMGAMSAGAVASGSRSWLATKIGRWSWLTRRRLTLVTRALIAAALVASALIMSGSG